MTGAVDVEVVVVAWSVKSMTDGGEGGGARRAAVADIATAATPSLCVVMGKVEILSLQVTFRGGPL